MIVGAGAMPDVEIVDEELFKPDTHDGPNWWTGNVVQPRVVQQRGAAIIAYQAKEIQKTLFGERTHAWFPKHQFEQTRGPESARCNFGSARWFFGAVGDSYVGLFSALETTWTDDGPWKDREIRAEGPANIFILQIGSRGEFGSFESFVTKVSRARVHISGLYNAFGALQCSYDIPFADRLELHYEAGPRYAGRPLADDEFPRFRNPFARVGWLQDRYAIQFERKSVTHDVAAGVRTLGGALTELAHATPLTVYAQNMGLLPWPLYKGIDRDGALGHLIAILRERRPDVVGLSEMWSAGDRERIRWELSEVYPYTLDGPNDPLAETPAGDVELMGGGLLLLSRHRIVTSTQTVYRHCSGDDCLAAKGALHARVQPRGHPCAVDLFLTHTQAAHPTLLGTTAGARSAIEAQIRHLAAFVRSCRDPVAPALLFGDFNVDGFAHRDLYEDLVSALGNPRDLAPMVLQEGAPRPTATSESDDGDISSFHTGHPSRDADDLRRFGPSAERLDYLFSFPGWLYSQRISASRVVVEQWSPGRDMSDHYGIETSIDTTVQVLPPAGQLSRVRVRLLSFHCLRPTSGLGNDEVTFSLTVKPARGAGVSQSTEEIEDVKAGTIHGFDLAALEVGDPDGELDIFVEGREVDSLSADDLLGKASLTLGEDELLALAGLGPTRVGLPLLSGDGSQYVVEVEISIDADQGRSKSPRERANR
jgi:hypothetical protein